MNQVLIIIYLNAKDTYEAKYQLLINKRESRGLLNTQMMWIISRKILKNTIQIRNEKY